MKLIMAVVHNDDAPIVTSELNKAGFHSTKIASTGGFLSSGNTTFITGVEDGQVDEVVKLISENGKKRSHYVPTNAYPTLNTAASAGATAKIQTGGATIFVLGVESFFHV